MGISHINARAVAGKIISPEDGRSSQQLQPQGVKDFGLGFVRV